MSTSDMLKKPFIQGFVLEIQIFNRIWLFFKIGFIPISLFDFTDLSFGF